jgi:cation transport protein ChaC
MRLTAELVGRIARHIDDPGLEPGRTYCSEADYDAAVATILANGHALRDVWIFGYGSLISKPACEFVEQRIGHAYGWHRSFCLQLKRFRGTPEQPGLMMALDRGGECKGVAYRLPPDAIATNLGKLLRREIPIKPSANSHRVPGPAISTSRLTPGDRRHAIVKRGHRLIRCETGHTASTFEAMIVYPFLSPRPPAP